MIRCAGVLIVLAGCAPAFTAPPDQPALAPAGPVPAQVVVTEDGRLEAREDPYAPRALRRADHDVQATLLAPGVALVVEPAAGAPVYVSNLLAAALVRRFGGHLPTDEAMAAPVAFLIRPHVSPEALTQEARLVVDWRLRSEDGGDLGAVYAARRVTGEVTRGDPWTAVSAVDAEHVALQTAAHLIDATPIRAALAAGALEAEVATTPTPAPRPNRTVEGSEVAPRLAPAPPRSVRRLRSGA